MKNKNKELMDMEDDIYSRHPQPTNLPLWKVLNEQRTQGKWQVASTEPGDEYSSYVLAPVNIDGEKRAVVKATYDMYFGDNAEANAQYTALAVNNLHILAEALEKAREALRKFDKIDKTFTAESAIDDVNEALNRIS